MDVYTDSGTKEGATNRDLDQALDALQQSRNPDAFVGVQKRDGSCLQMRQLQIEHRGPTGDTTRRASVPPAIRTMFRQFADDDKDWDPGLQWIERQPTRWWEALPWWTIALPWVVFGALLYWTMSKLR